MNRKTYKRYQEIKEEISKLNEKIEESQDQLVALYTKRNTKGIRDLENALRWNIRERCQLVAIRDELLLPQYVKIENGVEEVLTHIKDNNIGEPYLYNFVEEYVAMYLTDEYNHDVEEFTWHCDEKNIYVTQIRWNENQILPIDVKRVIKDGKMIDNCYVTLTKYYGWKGYENRITFHDKSSGYTQIVDSYTQAIRMLEARCYM